MKKLFTLFAMLACVAVASAQHRLVATLSHNDTVSVYYGKSAFYYAYQASVDGDIITLSSGVFDATSIEKSIIIRGAGMEQDTVNNIAPTIISGSSMRYNICESPILEGIRMNCEFFVKSGKCFSGKFTKCIINCFHAYSNDSYTNIWEAEFIQCKIEKLLVYGKATVINSYVGSLSGTISELSMTNCVVGGLWRDIENTIFANCVLLHDNVVGILPSSNMAYNCICVYEDVFANLDVNTNNARVGVGVAFKDTGFYELQDSVKTKYLGTDGTEVGIYGGPAPFNPTKTSYPRIEKFSVSQMNENGEVKVDVKVSTVEE